MMLNFTRSVVAGTLIKALSFALALGSFSSVAAAQADSNSPVSAEGIVGMSLSDTRFRGITEDWSTPSLAKSNLKPTRPLMFADNTHPAYTVELLQMQWRPADAIDLYVMTPKGVTKPPVILYLFGYPTDTDMFKNEEFQSEVTRDGFAAVCFVSALTGQRYHTRPMKEWFLSELQESLGKSAHDVQMVLNYLASRGDVDMDRVGMFGQKSGGSIAILASAVDPRIKVLDVLDPWGDWPTWMAKSPFVPEEERPNFVKPEFLEKAATLEPVDWLPKVQAKKFRFQDAVFENNTPKSSKEKLRAAVPAGTKVVLYQTEKEFEAAFPNNSVNLAWMKHELNALPKSSAVANATSPAADGTKAK